MFCAESMVGYVILVPTDFVIMDTGGFPVDYELSLNPPLFIF